MHEQIYILGISLTEWIGIAQAVILFFTAIVIVWYTIETKKIREATSVQNTLLAEQLRILQLAEKHELAKELSFIKPYLKFGGGMTSSEGASWEFVNKGGPAKKLVIKSLGKFFVNINPTRFMDTNEKGSVNFRSTEFVQAEKYPFEVTCKDKLDNEHVFKFYYQHQRGVFEEE